MSQLWPCIHCGCAVVERADDRRGTYYHPAGGDERCPQSRSTTSAYPDFHRPITVVARP